LNAFFDGNQFAVFHTFAFLIPVVEAFVNNRLVARTLTFLSAFLMMAGLEPFRISAPALAIAGLLQAYLLIRLYRNFGLLSVMISAMASPYSAQRIRTADAISAIFADVRRYTLLSLGGGSRHRPGRILEVA
jgi:hypothetical protein